MHPLDAIELIAAVEPNKLGILACDLARLVLERADRETNGGVDPRLWAVVDCAEGFDRGELTADDVDLLAREATEVVLEHHTRRVQPYVVAAAALAAEVTKLVAIGDTDSAAFVTRDVFGRTRYARVPDVETKTLLETYVSEFTIFRE